MAAILPSLGMYFCSAWRGGQSSAVVTRMPSCAASTDPDDPHMSGALSTNPHRTVAKVASSADFGHISKSDLRACPPTDLRKLPICRYEQAWSDLAGHTFDDNIMAKPRSWPLPLIARLQAP